MEKCHQLYQRLQQDLKNLGVIISDNDLLNDENMAMFCLNIMMKQGAIKERDEDIFNLEHFKEIKEKWKIFDDKTKKTIWLYFDLFVKLSQKYTKDQLQNHELAINDEEINDVDITSKMSQVSSLLEDKLGMKMNAGMEDMVGIIAKEVQNEIKRGNTNMQGIIKNVMEKVIEQFKSKIESGEIDVEDLKQSAEKLMSQIGNPTALMGLGGNNSNLSQQDKRKARRERLRKRLEQKQKKN